MPAMFFKSFIYMLTPMVYEGWAIQKEWIIFVLSHFSNENIQEVHIFPNFFISVTTFFTALSINFPSEPLFAGHWCVLTHQIHIWMVLSSFLICNTRFTVSLTTFKQVSRYCLVIWRDCFHLQPFQYIVHNHSRLYNWRCHWTTKE
jgi:hypothetical protein